MDVSLRTTFDREAERYDRARPAPPKELVEAMIKAGNLQTGARVLEVGCGTGQATRPLAEQGLGVVALELGPALAALAQRNQADFPNVTVEQTAFEAFQTTDLFDALVSVQAFHWIEPKLGLAKAASLLRPNGALLLAWHQDVLQNTPFYRAADPVFERYAPGLEHTRPTPTFAPERFRGALEASPEFENVSSFRFPWRHRYSKERFLDLCLTFSNVQAQGVETRAHFLTEMAKVIDAHGGSVVCRYESVLLSAYRRP